MVKEIISNILCSIEEIVKKWNFYCWDIRKKWSVEEHQLKWVIRRMFLMLVLLGILTYVFCKIDFCFEASDKVKTMLEIISGGLMATDMLLTQISVSFIVISLTSILSSNAKIIYWTDKVEVSLIKPVFTSFVAYASYIFACLLWSSVWFIIKSEYVAISFWISIIVMAFLTFKMIDVYFGNSKIKKQVEWYFEWMEKYSENDYNETKQKMITIMSKNMIENDFATFFENFQFLYDKGEYSVIVHIVNSLVGYNMILFEELLNQILGEIDDEKSDFEKGIVKYKRNGKYIGLLSNKEVKKAVTKPFNISNNELRDKYSTISKKIDAIKEGV